VIDQDYANRVEKRLGEMPIEGEIGIKVNREMAYYLSYTHALLLFLSENMESEK
jgi:hypothetical protein